MTTKPSQTLLDRAVQEHERGKRLLVCADTHAALALVARGDGGKRYEEQRADHLWGLATLALHRSNDTFRVALAAERDGC